jgi:beta-lactamase class A
MLTRRSLLVTAAAVPIIVRASADDSRLAEIEKSTGGRLGVSAVDTASGKRIEHRADERFPMCSTFKLLAVAAVLARVDKGQEKLDRWVPFGEADLLGYAPVSRAHVSEGRLTLDALCAAAVQWSDNTAANLILASLGGPSAVTRYARSIGDPVTRLDRTEPTLNSGIPGDPRDTTSPRAMMTDLGFLTSKAFSPELRTKLVTWLANYRVGDARIPAGLPKGWRCGHKTGTGDSGIANDVAIIWPPGRKPILVAAYCAEAKVPLEKFEAALADVGRYVTEKFS